MCGRLSEARQDELGPLDRVHEPIGGDEYLLLGRSTNCSLRKPAIWPFGLESVDGMSCLFLVLVVFRLVEIMSGPTAVAADETNLLATRSGHALAQSGPARLLAPK